MNLTFQFAGKFILSPVSGSTADISGYEIPAPRQKKQPYIYLYPRTRARVDFLIISQNLGDR